VLAAARARARADRHAIDAVTIALHHPYVVTVPALESDPVEVAGIASITRALGAA
jgi:hypothetical protein